MPSVILARKWVIKFSSSTQRAAVSTEGLKVEARLCGQLSSFLVMGENKPNIFQSSEILAG